MVNMGGDTDDAQQSAAKSGESQSAEQKSEEGKNEGEEKTGDDGPRTDANDEGSLVLKRIKKKKKKSVMWSDVVSTRYEGKSMKF